MQERQHSKRSSPLKQTGVVWPPPPASGKPGALPASMLLLQTILDSALDPGYRAAARQPPRRLAWWHKALLTLVVVLLGFGTGTSVRFLRADASQVVETHSQLMEKVLEAQAGVGTLTSEVDGLEAQVEERAQTSGTLPAALPATALASALTEAQGPGVVVTLSEQEASGFVRDQELRALVNLLWYGGAEAIAVNGERIGPGTTIRTAGSAILVNLTAVASPYQVEAIGDPQSLLSALSSGQTGEALAAYVSSSGFKLDIDEEPAINIRGARMPRILYAEAVAEEGSGS